jgi:hypothetical protein
MASHSISPSLPVAANAGAPLRGLLPATGLRLSVLDPASTDAGVALLLSSSL